MKRIDLKVGFSCNNSCKFCVQGNKRSKIKDKTTSEIKTILEKEHKRGYDGVVFTGGEPTLRKDICELVSLASRLGFRAIQIQTNGRLFYYKDFCKKLIGAGVTEFSPAVHGHNAKIHDYLTSADGSFKETVGGIINLRALRQRVLTNTVVTRYNYKFLPQIAKLLVGLDVSQFQFAFIHITGTAELNADWIVPRKADIMPYVKKGLSIGIKAKKRVMTEAIPYCFMRGYEEFVAERVIPDTEIFDAGFIIDNYSNYRKETGKVKGPRCKDCKYFSLCEGPWKEYPKLYGWDEFKPVDK